MTYPKDSDSTTGLPTGGGGELVGRTDEQLVLDARAGDELAFGCLLARYKEEVTRLLWRFSGNVTETQDLAQDVFMRVIRKLPEWREHQPFAHWLRRITVNVGRDYCRKRRVRERWVAPAQDEAGVLQLQRDTQPAPDARLAMNEVRVLLNQMSADDRVILTLQYLEGWELGEIARAYGWPAPLMKLKSFRARAKLRRLYEQETK